ncbi:hypothetical protein NL108_000596 [Boleophthalmus pectinirostris]|uniref:E3 ubiquitin/ISG15 ligase TRIM25-like n=1 Tax=Boleophthalmus pectinirostris TaxID=150288 RepID=UPI00243292B6|nr:E3 ubiquitin/ISG15 ligase TRIM25-like [Boleophthalmus pectinirostris]KAJ0049738.1 hypothetical protein NL108_000596 [Boleophthalmus pectinirostris]
MASGVSAQNCTVSMDQFVCSICLEVFTDPVTTPCGHSFCRACITQHWDSYRYNCPLCKQNFSSRPELNVNIVLAGMISEAEMENREGSRVSSNPPNGTVSVVFIAPERVSCDVCLQPKLGAVLSCITCKQSYCQSHLLPHLTDANLKKHLLKQPKKQSKGGSVCGWCVYLTFFIVCIFVLKSLVSLFY